MDRVGNRGDPCSRPDPGSYHVAVCRRYRVDEPKNIVDIERQRDARGEIDRNGRAPFRGRSSKGGKACFEKAVTQFTRSGVRNRFERAFWVRFWPRRSNAHWQQQHRQHQQQHLWRNGSRNSRMDSCFRVASPFFLSRSLYHGTRSVLLRLYLSLSVRLCRFSPLSFSPYPISFVLLFPSPSRFSYFFLYFFFSFCFLFFFLLLFFLVLLPFARKLVHIRIGGRSSAARSLIKSHKNREAVSSPASYGNREVEPVLNIDSGSSLYTECIRRESLLMLNEF